MKVKICGIKTCEEAQLAAKAQPDFIGVVLAPSKRQISLETVKEITGSLKGTGIKVVGVYVNPTKAEVDAGLNEAGLDYIQFHGDEDKDFVEQYRERAIKAFPSNSELSYEERFDFGADYILIDSPREKYYGGSGVTFNWSELPLETIDKSRLALAGGLNPDNVGRAAETVAPALIDVSSGVETDGEKDPEKIAAFIKNIRGGHND
ncbi:N-(5'-phosphoribosyl)anthranilate isomerase [Jeotgalicoccus coquinae]|uniref:N-(5'-phosphoribosyl)anthranilate isomerase n=1 Tax=Jeotgalicoccus coquinae TaxID=709509 RepID=A0A6V7RMV0_9STAP|nr:phosphoribosylanthranilate isomerase [Jeotgalicoccus coquinae]MBB6422376.1 phosphoribosylanthranilate isomerase [Jeotgalicoccus coquinae]GGE16280.1 N-(5'-phosphoribosyl)anthranilate isomerase [Jeotgalicoccus coquinae]CAD2078774.1 N-(5'-phosphoribosyl)anthranilate isomerase [Jeotgalicoccus coquinae]